MIISKKGVSCGFAVSLLTVRFTPAWAENCANFRAQMATVGVALDKAEAEEGRVGRIPRPPYTDAALCAAENKAIRAGHLGQLASDRKCFDSDAKYNDFKSSLDSLLNRLSKIAGLYHCSH
jgi:hypothetical protein